MLTSNWYNDKVVLLYEKTAGVHYAHGASHPIWVLEGLLKAMSLMNEQWSMRTANEVDGHIKWDED